MERYRGIIFPPCGAKIGESDLSCDIVCPAMFWEQAAHGTMKIESINRTACELFLEEGSCPEGLDSSSLG